MTASHDATCRELREPDLPRTAKDRPQALRTGWTTGTCASAAAKAATLLLAGGAAPGWVEVGAAVRPPGHVRRASGPAGPAAAAEAVVVKDAGDDPDVTHGAHLTATVAWRDGDRASSWTAASASAW